MPTNRRNPDPLGMLKASANNQPLKTFVARNVQPQAVSTIQLSGGKNKPYHYSLATTSTVPFASVEGSGGIQKEFSWGEVIQVPPGVTVNVRNASRHAGDIIIQSGEDRSNTPARISFPIAFQTYGVAGLLQQTGFIDTRRARRCYWVTPGFEAALDARVYILGYYAQHTANPEGNNILDNASWLHAIFLNVGDVITYVPIAMGVDIPTFVTDNMLPMMMADYQRIYLEEFGENGPPYSFVVLEYL